MKNINVFKPNKILQRTQNLNKLESGYLKKWRFYVILLTLLHLSIFFILSPLVKAYPTSEYISHKWGLYENFIYIIKYLN